MRENNLIAEKSMGFAIRIVNLYKYLVEEKREKVMSQQLIRSGTSIGANVREAIPII
jgi:four helix bundle protein